MHVLRFSHSIEIILFLAFVGQALADANVQPDPQATILRRYFATIGFEVDFDHKDHSIVDKYGKEVIERMSICLNETDTSQSYATNADINYLIYENKNKEIPSEEECKPIRPHDEVMFRVIDLIVPDSSADDEYTLAKKDLRRFYLEEQESAIELLNRIRMALEEGELHTDEAALFLEHFYNHWIPLGRLKKFVESKGTTSD